MIQVTRYVEWIEPWLPDQTGPAQVCRVTEAMAIALRHAVQKTYHSDKLVLSDEDALQDFMIAYWATPVTVIEVIPDEPSVESHFPLST